MSVFANKRFHRERIILDGNEFSGCMFNECDINYDGGTMLIGEGCTFQQCHWVFGGAAHNTIEVLHYIRVLSKSGLKLST
jgi:hypothetical protein